MFMFGGLGQGCGCGGCGWDGLFLHVEGEVCRRVVRGCDGRDCRGGRGCFLLGGSLRLGGEEILEAHRVCTVGRGVR